ncbi:AntA/AntB antirepressor [Vibrio phage 1.042.O._10N.286.45.B8]|nr:AntA/AntB antirepressor [Vibrio phage 1.042.O._10N.286.45.B8]
MSDHYTISTVSKKELVNAFDLGEEEAKLIHRYRNQLPAIFDAEEEEGFCVDASDLHKQLKSKTRFRDWSKKINKLPSEYFREFLRESTGGRPEKGFMLTTEGAKQVAMMEMTDVGDTVRRYFTLCERLVIRMARRNPIRQNCKDSTKGLFNNIAGRVPKGKQAKVMAEMHAIICTTATGARPSVWKKNIGADNVRDFLKENAKVHELKRYDEVAQMAEMLSRDISQTKKSIKAQLEKSFGDSEIYFSYLYESGVKEF